MNSARYDYLMEMRQQVLDATNLSSVLKKIPLADLEAVLTQEPKNSASGTLSPLVNSIYEAYSGSKSLATMLNALSHVPDFQMDNFLNTHQVKKDPDFKGNTLYMVAARFAHTDCMELLVSYGYNPSLKVSVKGKTISPKSLINEFIKPIEGQKALKDFHDDLILKFKDKNKPKMKM